MSAFGNKEKKTEQTQVFQEFKVKFNEETKKKFRDWLKKEGNYGRGQFCKELKQFDLDGYFTVIGMGDYIGITCDPMRVKLKEMPTWYFSLDEFENNYSH